MKTIIFRLIFLLLKDVSHSYGIEPCMLLLLSIVDGIEIFNLRIMQI